MRVTVHNQKGERICRLSNVVKVVGNLVICKESNIEVPYGWKIK